MRTHLNTYRTSSNHRRGGVERIIQFCRLLAFALLVMLPLAAHGEKTPIAWVRIGNTTYSNVVIREVSGPTVTLEHSRGMASLNQTKLSRRELEDLGLVEKVPPPQPKQTRTALPPPAEGPANPDAPVSVANFEQYATQLQSLDREHLQQLLDQIPRTPIKYVLIVFGSYFFLCLCFMLICSKAGKPAPLLSWLPALQIFALYRAAGMSPVWFALMILDVLLHIAFIAAVYLKFLSGMAVFVCATVLGALAITLTIGGIIWCFKIASARGKSPLIGVMLLLPGLNALALLYLAFSGGTESKLDLQFVKTSRSEKAEAR